MRKDAIFMIESGKALEMVKEHISERKRVRDEIRVIVQDLGVNEIFTDKMTGVLTSVIFPRDIHPEFTKPKRRNGGSYPKKGSSWDARLKKQTGYKNPSSWISKEFNIPLSIGFGSDNCKGWRCIGSPLTECGFLYLSEQGPYAMWTPDIAAEVAASIAEGYTVGEPAASFKLEIDGCRRIEKEEWEILVLQHTLAQKQATVTPTVNDAGTQEGGAA
jgi:hypothetical protein